MISIHEKINKNTIVKAVIWITLFSMTGGSLLFTPQIFKKFGGSSQPSVFIVNGQDITIKEAQYRTAHELERIAFIRQQLGEYADQLIRASGLDNPEKTAVQSLIMEALLNGVADKIGLRVSSDYALRMLQDPAFVMRNLRDIIPIQAFEQNGALNTALLGHYLNRFGFSLSDFEIMLEQVIKRSIVTDLIKSTAYVSNADIKEQYDATHRGKKYSILTFALAPFLKQATLKAPSLQELADFFDQENTLSKKYWTDEQRTIKVWKFTPDAYEIRPTQEQLNEYYQHHKQQFIDQPVMVQVRHILLPIKNKDMNDSVWKAAQKIKSDLAVDPSKFAALAQQYSGDVKTAAQGGLLPFFKKGETSAAFEKAAFRLYNDGDISDITVTDDGLEIIQRVQRKPATYKPFEIVKKDIVAKVSKELFKEAFTSDLRSMVDSLNSNNQPLFDLAIQKKSAVQTITVHKNSDNPLAAKAFKIPLQEWGFVVDQEGNGNVVTVVDINKSHQPSLESVKSRVEKDYYAWRAHKALDATLTKAKEMAKTTSLAQIKDALGGSLEKTGWINQDSKDQLESLDKKGFPVEVLLGLNHSGSVAIDQNDTHGYLMRYDEQEPFNQADFDAKKQEIKTLLSQDQKDLIYRGYIASLDRHATLKVVQHETQNEGMPQEDSPL
jgi:parvulin-like peptidyl-prolyl isomerase